MYLFTQVYMYRQHEAVDLRLIDSTMGKTRPQHRELRVRLLFTISVWVL